MAPRRRNRPLGRWCWYCGRQLTKATASKDHKVPKRAGGGNGTNLVDAFIRCNNRKGHMSVEKFRTVFFGDPGGKFYGERKEEEWRKETAHTAAG